MVFYYFYSFGNEPGISTKGIIPGSSVYTKYLRIPDFVAN